MELKRIAWHEPNCASHPNCVYVHVCVHIYDLLQYDIGTYQYVVGVKIQRMCYMKTWLLYYGEGPSV